MGFSLFGDGEQYTRMCAIADHINAERRSRETATPDDKPLVVRRRRRTKPYLIWVNPRPPPTSSAPRL